MSAETCIKIRDEYCGKCVICSSICPFEAISLDKETGAPVLDIDKCRVCGLCFSACPTSSIELAYYKTPALINYIMGVGKENFVLMCKGATLRPEMREYLRGRGIGDDFTLLYVPCVGRIPPEFILKLFTLGVKRVAVLLCEKDKCRFEAGSNVGALRFSLLQRLLSQLGFSDDVLTIVRSTLKARINAYRCMGCGNCAYICPYDAIRIEPPGIAQMNEDACRGCGACAAVCSALAINMEDYDHNTILEKISEYRHLINDIREKSKKPAILVFYCQWANFPQPGKHWIYPEENVIFMEMPCSSMFNPLYVLHALYNGFDGVLIAACKKDECRFERGNELAERYVTELKKILKGINLDDRLEICFVSPRYLKEIDDWIKSFISRVIGRDNTRSMPYNVGGS